MLVKGATGRLRHEQLYKTVSVLVCSRVLVGEYLRLPTGVILLTMYFKTATHNAALMLTQEWFMIQPETRATHTEQKYNPI